VLQAGGVRRAGPAKVSLLSKLIVMLMAFAEMTASA
jgi:hypothetical protein